MEQINSKQQFQELISSSPDVLVEFYASWCPHCKAFLPNLEQAADQLAQAGIPAAQVEIDANEDIAHACGINVIPTLMFFKNGKPVLKSEGERSAAEVIAFADKGKQEN